MEFRHFLSVPTCQEVAEAVKGVGSCHSILKVTRSMKKKKLDMEVIDSEGNISSAYISTRNFQKKPLCKILVAWRPWGSSEKAECLHPSLKRLVVTKRKGVCSHTPFALAAYCYCEAASDDFERKIKSRCHEPTAAVMRLNIEKKSEISYNISVRLAGLIAESEQRSISHMTLCKYNGVKKLGEAIQDRFDCPCDKVHCGRGEQIRMRATEVPSNEVVNDSELLVCDKVKNEAMKNEELMLGLEGVHHPPAVCANSQIAPASAENKLTFSQIMEDEITRPHRPGEEFNKQK